MGRLEGFCESPPNLNSVSLIGQIEREVKSEMSKILLELGIPDGACIRVDAVPLHHGMHEVHIYVRGSGAQMDNLFDLLFVNDATADGEMTIFTSNFQIEVQEMYNA